MTRGMQLFIVLAISFFCIVGCVACMGLHSLTHEEEHDKHSRRAPEDPVGYSPTPRTGSLPSGRAEATWQTNSSWHGRDSVRSGPNLSNYGRLAAPSVGRPPPSTQYDSARGSSKTNAYSLAAPASGRFDNLQSSYKNDKHSFAAPVPVRPVGPMPRTRSFSPPATVPTTVSLPQYRPGAPLKEELGVAARQALPAHLEGRALPVPPRTMPLVPVAAAPAPTAFVRSASLPALEPHRLVSLPSRAPRMQDTQFVPPGRAIVATSLPPRAA